MRKLRIIIEWKIFTINNKMRFAQSLIGNVKIEERLMGKGGARREEWNTNVWWQGMGAGKMY